MTRRLFAAMMWSYSTAALLFLLSSVQAEGPLNLLMVGNSFSESHNMEEMIQAMLEEREIMLHHDSVFAARFEVGGANMTHYAHAKDLTVMIQERKWSYVILQEQSQIPGFCGDKNNPKFYLSSYNDSLKSVLSLDDQIEGNGATTILFETWGYFDQDPYNPGLFPDYPTMQDKLRRGYQIYRDNIVQKNDMANVRIAPAGLAFSRIYKQLDDKGEDPHKEGSLFEQLYMRVEEREDHNKARKYPTLAGSYLCGCVLFQTITGLDVRQSGYTPPGLDVEMRKKMQEMAYQTVVEFQGNGEAPRTTSSSATKPPYKPDYKSERMAETRTSSSWNWILAAVLMGGGLASYWVAYKKRAAPRLARDYGWNPVSSEDFGSSAPTMELSDIQQPQQDNYNSPDLQRV